MKTNTPIIPRLFPSATRTLGLALLAAAAHAPAAAGVITNVIVPQLQARYGAGDYEGGGMPSDAGGTDGYQTGIIAGNAQVGFAGPFAGTEEFRNIMAFNLDGLGVTSSQIATATLKFAGFSWNAGAWNSLMVDQITTQASGTLSYFNYNNYNMYQAPEVSNVAFNRNSLGDYDITDIFKTALDNASPTTGIAFRVWNNGTVGFAPFSVVDYSAPAGSKITGNAYGTLGAVTLEYTVIANDPAISIARNGGNLEVTWTGGRLESTDDLAAGPWTTVPGATSPYVFAPTEPKRFFRAVDGSLPQ